MFNLFSKKSFLLTALLFTLPLFFTQEIQAQTVTGTVLDAQSKEPLAGASVYVANTNQGTSTETNGSFRLTLSGDIDVLTVSFVGYKTQEVEVQPELIIYLEPSTSLEDLIIQGVRAKPIDPVAQSTIQRQELEKEYNGEQPVFYLDKLTPSIFSYSESGTNLANYGSMRLRGISQDRINMTLNGIPLNDMIDQGVFFSNFSDISNSFESVQVQRGVGTSSNGVASYAGSINFESVNLENRDKGGQIELSAGSFESYRLNGSLSSGMIDSTWSFYSSYSRILSDGYRYNTSTDAYSFFFSGGYFGEKDMVKLNVFDANSKNGLGYSVAAKSDLEADPRTNYLNENDKDDFGQRLIQLQHTHIFSDAFSTSSSLYYGGAGGDFFYSYADGSGELAQINFPLYNDHYGAMVNGFYETGNWNVSSGLHGYIFNRINEESVTPDFENPYYNETSDKKELSWFAKAEWNLDKLKVYGDLQIRTATLSIQPDYQYIGISPEEDIVKDWTFINPKIGLSYSISEILTGYVAAGRMGREPTKVDIFGGFSLGAANYDQARANTFDPEYVNDYEAGIKVNYQKLALNANFFYMDFQDEIAPIGELIAFGVQKRSNIPDSYRTGLEVEFNILPVEILSWRGNFTYMKSEIESFTTGDGTIYNNKTPILSPELIMNQTITVSPLDGLSFGLYGNYVSKSYLELTNNSEMILPSYFTVGTNISYELSPITFKLELNNLTDEVYYSGGAPVDLDFDGTADEPGYFVNAGFNFFLTTTFRF